MIVHVYPAEYAREIEGHEIVPIDDLEKLDEIEVLVAPAPPRTGWARATRLRVIHVLGVGVSHFLPSPDLPDRVQIATVRGVFAVEVAEHAIAMMLAHVRRSRELYDNQRARQWNQTERGSLAGQHAVIVGRGAIGSRIATLATAFGMRVTLIGRTNTVSPDITQHSVEEVSSRAALLRAATAADHLIIACPLTAETRYLVDADALAALPSTAHVVNVARGGIVDEAALLRSKIAASLDVFETEPLPTDSPLWEAPQITVTPHVAGLADRYVERCWHAIAQNLDRLSRNEPLRGLVDRSVGY